jgi:hypothetical protein
MMTGNFHFEEDPFSVPARQPSSSSGRTGPKKNSSRDSVSTTGTTSSRSSTESTVLPRTSRNGTCRETAGGSGRRGEGRSQAHTSRGIKPQPPLPQNDGFADFGSFDDPVFPETDAGTFAQAQEAAAPVAARPRRTRRASIATSTIGQQVTPETQSFGQEEADYGYGPAEVPQEPAAAPQRARRTRRSSMYGDSGASTAVSSVDRQPPRSSRSCDGLETMVRPPQGRPNGSSRPVRSSASSVSDCSVVSTDSAGSGGPGSAGERPAPRRRAGRRASVGMLGESTHSAPDYGYERPQMPRTSSHQSNNGAETNEYGYEVDYGYDANQQPETTSCVKEERRRLPRNFTLDDFKSDGGGAETSRGKSSRQLGATIGVNIVLPMAEPEKPRRQRRASLIGAIGAVGEAVGGVADVATLGLLKERKKTKEVIEEAPEYDPSQDMSRRSGLLDRVSSSASGTASRSQDRGTSYSDRIMKPR